MVIVRTNAVNTALWGISPDLEMSEYELFTDIYVANSGIAQYIRQRLEPAGWDVQILNGS